MTKTATKELNGYELFWYLVNHFKMDYSEALYEMSKNNQDTKDVKQMLIAQNYTKRG